MSRFPRRGDVSPVRLYFALSGFYTLFFNIIIAVNLVYQTQKAGLTAFELVLVGTVLEATIFLCEVPTGIVADVYSRRLSIVIGMVLMGVGFFFVGAFARFETILAAQLVIGFGMTFVSGAQQAWIADEAGPEVVGQVYVRAMQVEQITRMVGLPIGIGLGVLSLGLPIMTGGALFVVLGFVLLLVMPERGFRPTPEDKRASWRSMGRTAAASARLVRQSPLLVTLFAIAAFSGAASEGFDRLWVKHFYDDLGFPSFIDLQPVIWFGVIRMGTNLIGVFGLEYVRRRIDLNSHRAVSHGLFLIAGLQTVCVFFFALAGGFYAGMLAFWGVVTLSRMFDPLYLGWINQNVDSSVRATVISMSSQVDSLGEIGGGPVLGAIAGLVSLRAAIFAAGAFLSPTLLLYVRSFGQGAGDRKAIAEAPASSDS